MNKISLQFTALEKAELVPVEIPDKPGPEEVRGPTLTSLVSPGTELAYAYTNQDGSFPIGSGYAAVFRAEEIGPEVKGIQTGDNLFCMGNHGSIQQLSADSVVPVPKTLLPQEAVIARLMGVSMTTLMTTKARPGDIVMVTGAGPVGYLCAQLFNASGYDVMVVDPDSNRRKMVKASGISKVFASIAEDDNVKGKVALVVDCSGHEQAVLDGAQTVRRGGEVVLVGVPWKKNTDLSAHELLNIVFHNYVVMRSGWEWELPHHALEFNPHSIFSGFKLALRWLTENRIPLEDLITLHKPEDAQAVYQNLLHGKAKGLFQVFDWQEQNGKI